MVIDVIVVENSGDDSTTATYGVRNSFNGFLKHGSIGAATNGNHKI